jgi:hypothetical protein
MLKLKRITPVFNHILTTKHTYDKDVMDNGMIVKTAGTVKEYQRVVAVGSTVKVCKPGDIIMINPTRYAVMKHQEGSLKDGVVGDNTVVAYNIPVINIDGKDHLLIYDTDIQFIMDKFEEVDDLPPLYVAPTPTILQ